MPRKKSKLETLTQTHGKEETFQPTSLEEIWGHRTESRYGTLDENEYQNRLREMTRSDLENHCRAMGFITMGDTERLRKELLKEFRNYISLLKKPVTPKHTIKVSEQAQRILKEGS